MKTITLILSILIASQVSFAKSRKKAKTAPLTPFKQCSKDIQNASASINWAGRKLDMIFRVSGQYKGFSHFSNLVKTGDRVHVQSAKRTLQARGEGVTTYGWEFIKKSKRSLRKIRPFAKACSNSCKKLDSTKQYVRNMQIKCEQINKVVSQFYSFTKKQTEAALYPAVDAIVAMKGTKRNYEILASAQKALDAEVNYSADLNDPTIEIDETAAVTVSK